MELQQMKYFLEAAKTGNFSAAAKNLFISPQSVAKQIGLLEAELGVTLFDRTGKSIKLNETGKYAYQRFQTVDTMLEDTLEAIKNMGLKSKNAIRIGFYSALPQKEFVSPIINLIFTSIEGVELKLKMLDLGEDMTALMSDELDMVFTNIEEGVRLEDCECIEFARKPVKIVVSNRHPWYTKGFVTREDFEHGTFIRLESARLPKECIFESSIYERIRCKDEVLVPNTSTLNTLLMQGKVFAIMPEILSEKESNEYKYFDLPGANTNFILMGIYKKNNDNPCIEKLRDLLEVSSSSYNF